MEQAILALLGVIITLILYLDRGRRADLAQLREEMHNSIAQLREEMHNSIAQLREETQRGFAYLHERIDKLTERVDKLTEVVMDLVNRVGRLEGRAEATSTPTQPSQ